MNSELIETLLKEVRDIRVGVIGDFCQDCYWDLCPEDDVVSVETGIAVQRFTKQRYSLGGAGNVAMNLSDLGVQNIYAFGVVGKDPFSKQMLALMNENGINSDGMLYQEENWNTPCYIKPITNGVEGHRMDFGCFNTISPEMESVLLSTIRGAMDHLDIVIVNQQLPPGLHSDTFIEGLNAIVIEANKFFILDSRDLGDKYHGMIKKINDYEVMLAAGHDVTPFDDIDIDDLLDACKKAFEKWQHAFVVTRGHKGCLIVKPGNISEIPGIKVNGEIDSVGAGDTFIAGLAAAFGGQSKLPEATEFANLMASITVTKLNETGTASPAEIREAASELNYLYHQDLAENVDKAVYWTDSSIEIINGPATDEIKHIIFDHDGTLSVLREGWERVMQPVMMKAILGEQLDTVDDETREKIHQRVIKFIDDTTGIQTLTQMKGLIDLVNEYGYVDTDKILDIFGYKKIYNDALMEMVKERGDKLKSGDLNPLDFAMFGAHDFVETLYKSGIKLYLASGTDQDDVIEEATSMGYADCFEGRIYGAVGDITREAKREVFERIIAEIGAENSISILAIGDGPVEIQEVKRCGGLAIGIASDEVECQGLNPVKRKRLICAGADLIISDFKEMEKILELLSIGEKVTG